MNSWFSREGRLMYLENHEDTSEFYARMNNYEKVLVFVPDIVVESGGSAASQVKNLSDNKTTLEEFLSTDVLYLVEDKKYSYAYVAELFSAFEGKPRNYFLLLS